MFRVLIITALATAVAMASAGENDVRVKIAPELTSITVTHNGESIVIRRSQDPENRVNPMYARTARACPPFCVQPIRLAPGVETLGELEMLDYLQRASAPDSRVLVIDSRTPDWVVKGTIPGSVNIPWTRLSPSAGADPFEIAQIFETTFGVFNQEGMWNFANAKTLVLFCNGMWCGQSPANIRTLLEFGYPAHRIKWYRGGMQDWENLGLTVVR